MQRPVSKPECDIRTVLQRMFNEHCSSNDAGQNLRQLVKTISPPWRIFGEEFLGRHRNAVSEAKEFFEFHSSRENRLEGSVGSRTFSLCQNLLSARIPMPCIPLMRSVRFGNLGTWKNSEQRKRWPQCHSDFWNSSPKISGSKFAKLGSILHNEFTWWNSNFSNRESLLSFFETFTDSHRAGDFHRCSPFWRRSPLC